MKEWLIEKRGEMSQKEVAKKCDISQQVYSAYEKGTRCPSVKTAKKIADVLGFGWTRFYEEKDAG